MQAINLNAFDLLAITGVDAKKFLQGQVTCNVDLLSPQRSLEGALCNVKGRVISDFRLMELNDVCYLALAPGMGPVVEQVLNRYIVFSKATCQQVSQGTRCLGLLGDLSQSQLAGIADPPVAAGDTVSTGNSLLTRVRGTVPRFELWQFSDSDPQVIDLSPLELSTDRQPWLLEDICSGIVHITPETTEQYLPEALNYDLSGVINFKKGCYTGQEIVARMHYRGTAKKRLFHVLVETGQDSPQTIQCLLAGAETPEAGELLSQTTDLQGRWHGLAILNAAAGEADSHVYLDGNSHFPARIEPLPYRD